MPAGPIRFGFFPGTVPGSGADPAPVARELEELGVDALAWGEWPTQRRDPYTAMARAAFATTSVLLGTVVTVPGLRHPAVLANQFMSLQELSDCRMFCGIGSGDLSLIQLGQRPYRLREFTDYAMAVRRLMAGEEISWDEHPLRMRLEFEGPAPPVWLAADGPRTIRAASQLADGAIVAQVGSPDVVRTTLERAAAGAAEVGRSLADFDIWFELRVIVTEHENGAIDIPGLDVYAARMLGYMWRSAGKPSRETIADAIYERKGLRLDPDIADRVWQFGNGWVDSNAYRGKANVRLMDELGLRDFAGRHFYISGPPAVIADGMAELIDAGARNFFIPMLTGDSVPALMKILAAQR
ncbi:MAG: LLM class flavin-dependent oxidoreductase [Solirubrobacteraceae bacterium]|jgi:alkanesulfonate monooxygenase SsuD/methylene tetrahydromethanopterin reductase-like flavin-dependent oxidoreductase (luciferase family)